MSTYGLVVQKKEMTRMWVNDKFASVTLLTVPTQEIVRYKTEEKDGYVAAVVGVGKKETGA
jgi:ribosomal protein L3